MPTSRPSAAASMPVVRRPPADRDEHVVALDASPSCRPSRRRRRRRRPCAPPPVTFVPVRMSSPCLRKTLVGFLDDVVVHAGEDRRQELDDGDLRAESAPDGAELEADDAAADDDEVLRDLRDLERADVREDALLVELEEGELDRYGAGGNDDVLRLVGRDVVPSGGPAATVDRRLPAFSVPRPFAHVILFFRNRNSMPFVFCPTTSSFRFSIVARSSDSSPTPMPCSRRVLRRTRNAPTTSSSALTECTRR